MITYKTTDMFNSTNMNCIEKCETYILSNETNIWTFTISKLTVNKTA